MTDAMPAATNYCTHPSFELDSNADGLANGFAVMGGFTGVPVKSIVAGRLGGYAQRIQYTGVAGDTGLDLVDTVTGAGTVVPGDVLTVSFYVKGTDVGCSPVVDVRYRTSANSAVSTVFSSAFTITSGWTRFSYTTEVAPALSDHVYVRPVSFQDVSANDTLDITIDDVCVERSAVLTPYFDGSYPDCAWTGVANASTSVRSVPVQSGRFPVLSRVCRGM